MYQITMAGGLNVAEPDARKHTAGRAQPGVDISNAALAHPDTVALNVLADGMPTAHHMTRVVRSQADADDHASGAGVASQTLHGPTRFARGSRCVFKEGAPAQRLGSVTAQNGVSMNAPGVALTPSQLTVLVNS